MASRQNRRNTGAYWAFADLKFAFAADQRRIADFDAGDIGDGVEFSRSAFKWNPKIARTNGFAYE